MSNPSSYDHLLITREEKCSPFDFSQRSESDRKHAMRHSADVSLATELTARDNTIHPFQEDVRAITSSLFFKKLSDQYQLAPSASPAFEDRLSHTMMASQVANTIAKRLHLHGTSRTLIQAIVMLHDIGHPPFSHEGEKALNRKLQEWNRTFDHEATGFKIATQYAHAGLSYAGLDMSLGVLEGLAKRWQRFVPDEELESARKTWEAAHPDHPEKASHFIKPLSAIPKDIREFHEKHNLHLEAWCPIEGQIASIADWLSYTVTDIADALNMALDNRKSSQENWQNVRKTITPILNDFPAANKLWQEIGQQYDSAKQTQTPLKTDAEFLASFINLFSRRLEQTLIDDVIETTEKMLYGAYESGNIRPGHAEDIRHLDGLSVRFSDGMIKQIRAHEKEWKNLLFEKIAREHVDVTKMVEILYDDLWEKARHLQWDSGDPLLSGGWKERYIVLKEKIIAGDANNASPETQTQLNGDLAELICDYIACNFSDESVKHYVKTSHPKSYKALTQSKAPAPYPGHPGPGGCR